MPGAGELSRALESAQDLDTLQKFCSARACTPDQVSDNGKRIHLLRVLQLMRSRGYQVSDLARPQHQPKKDSLPGSFTSGCLRRSSTSAFISQTPL